MLVLGIETSCDETGLALLDLDESGNVNLVAEVLASQVDLHALYGGVVPELASREHMKALPVLCEELFRGADRTLDEVSVVGVTCGPGLKGCLLVGVTFAQGIAVSRGLPLVPVNHLEGHLMSGELHEPALKPPYLALVVSGGHTELVLVEGLGAYEPLCRTLDDAAGEAFDKSANLLGLAYPGGSKLAALADSVSSSRYSFPKVSREVDDFSYSGLKTAVWLKVEREKARLAEDPDVKAEMAHAIQDAILDPLVHKTAREVTKRGLPLVVCGGVSANAELRRRLQARCTHVVFPPREHCVDNGAMIAFVAARRFVAKAVPPLELRSRWPVEELS